MAELPEVNVRAIEARAEVRQVRSMVDGSVNVMLNFPIDCIPQVKKLLDWLGMEVRILMEYTDDRRTNS